MLTKIEIVEPLYVHNEKRYIKIKILSETDLDLIKRLSKINSNSKKFLNSLEGNVLKIKVPYRYKRIDCGVVGLKTLYEYRKGDMALVEILYMGEWTIGDFSGNTWKLITLSQDT